MDIFDLQGRELLDRKIAHADNAISHPANRLLKQIANFRLVRGLLELSVNDETACELHAPDRTSVADQRGQGYDCQPDGQHGRDFPH